LESLIYLRYRRFCGIGYLKAIFVKQGSAIYHEPYHQVVGHSKTYDGIVVANHYGNDTSVTYTDCLETVTEFFKLEII
jgi:hypothetical protein